MTNNIRDIQLPNGLAARTSQSLWVKSVFGVILLIALGFQLKRRTEGINLGELSFQGFGWTLLGAVIVLSGVNWILEAKKWQIALYPNKIGLKKSLETVLVGLSMAIFTPGRIGDYAGRALHSEQSKRSTAIISTFLCSAAQLTVTLAIGLVSILAFVQLRADLVMSTSPFWLIIPIFLGLAAYFHIEKLVRIIIRLPLFTRIMPKDLDVISNRIKTRILGLSVIRYSVYVAQMVLLLTVFQVNIPVLDAILGVSILFLMQTLIPMPMLFQVATKIELALILWESFDPGIAVLSLVMLTLWFINVVIPGLVGYKILNFNKLAITQKSSHDLN